MDADAADAELARLLDEGDADLGAVELPADPLGPPLGVALPGGDRVAGDRLLHELQGLDRGRVRDHHRVQEQAVRTLHALDQDPHPLGLLERERVALRQLGHEGEHGEVGVAVEEDVLDEALGREAVDRVALAARAVREAGQHVLPVPPGVLPPDAGGIDHVGLDVEDELVAGDGALGGGGLERRLLRQAEAAAGVALRGERLVQGEQRRRGAAERLEEGAPGHADPLGVLADALERERVGARDGLGQRHRPELAVGGRVDLDRQRAVVRTRGHCSPPRSSAAVHRSPRAAAAAQRGHVTP